MDFNEVKKISTDLIKSNIVPYICGEPGIGKSAMAQEIADELNLELRNIHLAMVDPTDLVGFPFVKDGKGHFAHFDTYFPLEDTPLPEGKDGFLVFMDEITSCEHHNLKIVMRVITERLLGCKKLHPKTFLMAAGNPPSKDQFTQELPDAVLDRVVQLDMESNLDITSGYLADNLCEELKDKLKQFTLSYKPKTCTPRRLMLLNRIANNNPNELDKYITIFLKEED